MPRRVLVTRPLAESEELAAELARRGIEALIAPMLAIEPTGIRLDDPACWQAAAVTSGNGIDALAAAASGRAIAIFAVGGATAARARRLGFTTVRAASGTGHDLADFISHHLHPRGGPILWASGEEIRVDLVAELGGRGFAVDRQVLYRAVPAARIPAAAADALRDGTVDAALFFSPRSAGHFASLATDAGLARRTAAMTAHCLSPAVADALGALPWAAIRTAARPTREDLLATLDDTSASDPD